MDSVYSFLKVAVVAAIFLLACSSARLRTVKDTHAAHNGFETEIGKDEPVRALSVVFVTRISSPWGWRSGRVETAARPWAEADYDL
jgi:hypothetical protein